VRMLQHHGDRISVVQQRRERDRRTQYTGSGLLSTHSDDLLIAP